MTVEDRLLIWRLNRGDAAALSRVYEKYRDDLLRLAGSLLSDQAATEDVVQDVFVRFAGLIVGYFRGAVRLVKWRDLTPSNHEGDYIVYYDAEK